MKHLTLLFTLFFVFNFHLYGQKYVLDNEKILYSFQTNSGKTMTLCSDREHKYIIYRFGTKNKIQLEYPNKKDKLSWNKFEYSNWYRGGGVQNEGIDLNYVAFTINETKYVIFDTYFAVGDKHEIGIRVIDLSTNKSINILGNEKTQKGTLTNLRFDKQIKKGEELYD